MNVKAPRVLIVEDDENINNLLREALTKHGLNCTQAFSGTEGLIVFKNDKFDLVLLDLMMPGMDGQTLTQRIREVSKVPIIIVSAKSNVDSKVDLLTTGADDFIGKPFELKELIARVDVQLRHKENEENQDDIEHAKVMSFKDLTLDGEKYQVTVKGEDIGLRLGFPDEIRDDGLGRLAAVADVDGDGLVLFHDRARLGVRAHDVADLIDGVLDVFDLHPQSELAQFVLHKPVVPHGVVREHDGPLAEADDQGNLAFLLSGEDLAHLAPHGILGNDEPFRHLVVVGV